MQEEYRAYRVLSKVGGSMSVTLPVQYVHKCGLVSGETMVIDVEGVVLKIRPDRKVVEQKVNGQRGRFTKHIKNRRDNRKGATSDETNREDVE